MENLPKKAEVKVWATSYADERYKNLWESAGVEVEEFPKIKPYPYIYNYLRRLNEFSWDFRQKPPSRISMLKHRIPKGAARKLPLALIGVSALNKTARPLAKCFSKLHLETFVENRLEPLLTGYGRSAETVERLKKFNPSVVVTTGPFQFHQPSVVAEAKKMGIPTLAMIPSWDNITTKNRMVLKYDGYLVWSEQTKKELREYYSYTRENQVYLTGAPQFDPFFQTSLHQSKEKFCRTQQLDANLPLIVYALGSPNFLKEHHGALRMAEYVSEGRLGDVQMLVRPHPAHDNGELNLAFGKFVPRVRLQQVAKDTDRADEFDRGFKMRSQDKTQLIEWINTFRHADVVINTASTVAIDAAIFDCPVVNLDFDTQPDQSDQSLIKDINHLWTHYKPIAESGGVWMVGDYEELICAVKTYLQNPALHREKRRWIAEYVCQYLDGKSGERMAEAIIDFAERQI